MKANAADMTSIEQWTVKKLELLFFNDFIFAFFLGVCCRFYSVKKEKTLFFSSKQNGKDAQK